MWIGVPGDLSLEDHKDSGGQLPDRLLALWLSCSQATCENNVITLTEL